MDKQNAVKRGKYDTSRGNTTARGYGGDWQKVRAAYLSLHPVCECGRCVEMGRKRPANVVHHIKAVETHPVLRLDEGNLKAMHTYCHECEHGRAIDREFNEWKMFRKN